MSIKPVIRQMKDAVDTAARVLRDNLDRFARDMGESFGNFGRRTRGNDNIDTPGTNGSRPDAPTGQPRGEDGRFLPNNDVPIDSRYDRPSGWRAGMRDRVWDEARGPDGVVRDPVTRQPMNPNEPWVMGHEPGYEFRHHQRSAQERGITREQFLDEYYNQTRYRPETPTTSSRGTHELDWEDYVGPGSPFV